MIIDSDTDQLRKLSEGFSTDFKVLSCSRGSQALELFKLYQPSALILDPATYQLDGRHFIGQVRALSRRSPLPILALTRIATIGQLEASFGWNVDALYSKPCDAERLKKKLNECLGRLKPLALS